MKDHNEDHERGDDESDSAKDTKGRERDAAAKFEALSFVFGGEEGKAAESEARNGAAQKATAHTDRWIDAVLSHEEQRIGTPFNRVTHCDILRFIPFTTRFINQTFSQCVRE